MRVLGLSPFDKDSTCAIVVDGEVLYAAAEERFTRVKLQSGFPWRSLADGFARTGLGPEDIDVVAYPFLTWERETQLFERNLARERGYLDGARGRATGSSIRHALERVPTRTAAIAGLGHPNERMEKGAAKALAYRLLAQSSAISRHVAKRRSVRWGHEASADHKQWQAELGSALAELGLQGKLQRVEHHSAHAANVYYTSGFDAALIVTLDGYGSGLSGSISVGRDGRIERLHGVEFPHSLGTFYESVTSGLGFQPSRHEGKIVGLAAYGDPEVLKPILLSRFEQPPGDFRILESNNVFFARMLASRFPKIDVAAAYQHVLEIVACKYVSHYLRQTGLRDVVMSGGVAANVKLNQRILETPGVERVFIHPNMGDGGTGVGAAELQFSSNPRLRERWPDVYLGPDYSDDQIRHALQRAHLPSAHHTPIEPKIASLIAAGKVVARFNGRMEYGPRALGNRSILFHAREPAVNQWLNQRLGRTEYMPFAPATLHEHRRHCYRNVDGADRAAEFMTITFDCTERMKKESPAAVHVDGTARPQLVTDRSNPSFHRVLTEYYRISGIPTVINTSFNMHEEPIVCSPDDAIRAFLRGNLDYLAIGDHLVAHPTAGQPVTAPTR